MKLRVRPARSFSADVEVPGDKSISHRALILSALAEGGTELRGLGTGADVRATADCLRALGASISLEGSRASVEGVGPSGLRAPGAPLDCGNSGTSMRLLAGVLAGAGLEARLIGDESLSRRPMGRILRPLRAMGVDCAGREHENGERAPLSFLPAGTLRGMLHQLEVASAQVKTCLLLAGLHAQGSTRIVEPAPTRDHSERMLPLFGVSLRSSGGELRLDPPSSGLRSPGELELASDPSSAAFLLVAAACCPGSRLRIPRLCLGAMRTGFLDVMRRMGVDVQVDDRALLSGEVTGRVQVRTAEELTATRIRPEEIPSLVDEVPVLAVLATQARGETLIQGAGELRHKESDRLASVAAGLAELGAEVEELEEGLRIQGPTRLGGASLDCKADHRLGMAFAVAGLLSTEGVVLRGAEQVETSYPGFFEQIEALCPGTLA